MARPSETRPGPLNNVRGRSDSPEELRHHLSSAPPSYLLGALDNPGLSEDEIVLLLHNRAATPSVLERVGRNRRWVKRYEVKKALVRHPRTPVHLARNLVTHLYWRDLAEASEDVRVPATVRRQAEEILKVRLEEMTLGEKITLARRATRGVIAALRESDESRVLEALLGNAQLVEHDAVRIASGPGASGEVLAGLFGHPTWGTRHSVRLALLANSSTPVRVALHIVRSFPPNDLRRLSRDRRLPKIVRMGAERLLKAEGEHSGERGGG